ncbi:TOBE domain-containing protein [Piscinibacter sakaiensis]|uniref:TOBE domain-containing protein n=1 Tax=Piscinibacter sakaiensis TaxID=1547922 RepID=UPI003AB0F851
MAGRLPSTPPPPAELPADPATTAAGLSVYADLSLNVAGKSLGSARRLALLAEVARVGSITQAAKAVGLSYKAAWDAIEQMGNLAGEPLVERSTGGKGGGHSRLTARGEELVSRFALVEAEHRRFVERLNRRGDGLGRELAMLENIALRTSARNQFVGTVRSIRDGAVNDEIELAVIGGQTIVATVTRDSRIDLGLAPGATAVALIKASSVLLMTGPTGARISARNQLAGTVSRITPGAVNAEVVLALDGGGAIAAIITGGSVAELGLKAGDRAVALFKASSVIIAAAA